MAAYAFDTNLKDRLIFAVRSTLFNSSLADATLAPLTTTAGLLAAYDALSRHGSVAQLEIIRGRQDIEKAAEVGSETTTTALLTDAMVAAGNTMAILIASIDAKHSMPTWLQSRPASSHFYA